MVIYHHGLAASWSVVSYEINMYSIYYTYEYIMEQGICELRVRALVGVVCQKYVMSKPRNRLSFGVSPTKVIPTVKTLVAFH